LLAMPSISRSRHKQILDQLEPFKLKIRLTPSLKTLMSGQLKMQDVREVEVEDLLGRDPVEPDQRLLSQCIRTQHVAVTGAGGSIGS
jgi:FlaA1/EpsC-like NDP-sugar epimerase